MKPLLVNNAYPEVVGCGPDQGRQVIEIAGIAVVMSTIAIMQEHK